MARYIIYERSDKHDSKKTIRMIKKLIKKKLLIIYIYIYIYKILKTIKLPIIFGLIYMFVSISKLQWETSRGI